jgi:WxcM-like protein
LKPKPAANFANEHDGYAGHPSAADRAQVWRARFRYRELFYFFLARRSCALQNKSSLAFLWSAAELKKMPRVNKVITFRVKGSGLIPLRFIRDLPDGNLFIAEARRAIPFEIKRVYYVNNLANRKAVRGKHAHRLLDQVLVCLTGSFVLRLDDGFTRQRITLNDPSYGIRLGPMLWHTMSSFSDDCGILVLASDWYDEADYIRDHAEFLRMAAVDTNRSLR